MTDVVLFHHALGQTPGFQAFANRWRAAGHTVHTPDLFEGATFATVEEGVAHAESIGFGEIIRRGAQAAAELPERVVYAGFSMGVLPAQFLTQTRSGALGALLMCGGESTGVFSAPWPAGTPAQLHTMAGDPWAEVDVLRELAREIGTAELFLYEGDRHLFADRSCDDYDAPAADLLTRRTLEFLARVG